MKNGMYTSEVIGNLKAGGKLLQSCRTSLGKNTKTFVLGSIYMSLYMPMKNECGPVSCWLVIKMNVVLSHAG